MSKLLVVTMVVAFVVSTTNVQASRIKDLVTVQGVRANQLTGYGLVAGLQGTGDSLRNAPFTAQSIRSMMDRMGVNLLGAEPRTRNIAAVLVTAELPAFVGVGARIDITVSSLGDASSLAGGALIMTPLTAADGQIYAVAQGSITVSGFTSRGQAESLTHGVPTTGQIPNGAIVEREPPSVWKHGRRITLELRNSDFVTAVRLGDAINRFARQRYGGAVAAVENARVVHLQRPDDVSPSRFLAEIGDLVVEPDTPARVVIDERTGTIVIGKDVRVSKVALTHGNLTVRITEAPQVVQPNPFTDGRTVVENQTAIEARQDTGNFTVVEGASLDEVVSGLNRMGLKPLGIIAILQAIKASGALQAELVVK